MADKDRFTSEWDDMVWDLNIPEGKVHTMVDEGDKVEKDQYAEIAERGARFAGEHNTPMSSGNIQKAETQEIILYCTEQATEELMPLLDKLRHLGKIGASREITVEPVDIDDDGNVFYFDGDGSSKIQRMTLDGVEKACQEARIASRPGYDGEPVVQAGKGDMVEKVTPEGNEGQEAFMDRCIHNLISEGKTPQKSADQCYAIWHSSKGTSRKSQDPEAVKKASLVRLVFRGAISIGGLFVKKSR